MINRILKRITHLPYPEILFGDSELIEEFGENVPKIVINGGIDAMDNVKEFL